VLSPSQTENRAPKRGTEPHPGTGDISAAAPNQVELHANIDDMTGEVAAHALRCLLSAGALDAWIVPITMKKGRPGMMLCALSEVSEVARVTDVFFRETTTLGVRKFPVERATLSRRTVEIQTRFGPVPVKVSGDPPTGFKPEVDACIRIADAHGVPLRWVLAEVEAQGRSSL
jgi:hypothetical protein